MAEKTNSETSQKMQNQTDIQTTGGDSSEFRYRFLHITQFDLGYTFLNPLNNLECDTKVIKAFKNLLKNQIDASNIKFKEIQIPQTSKDLSSECVVAYSLTNKINAYIMNNGICMITFIDDNELPELLSLENFAVGMYHRRKEMHKRILPRDKSKENETQSFGKSTKKQETEGQQFGIFQAVHQFKNLTWKAIKKLFETKEFKKNKKTLSHRCREFSSKEKYKCRGFSYVLTIYQIDCKDKTNETKTPNQTFLKNIHYLLHEDLSEEIPMKDSSQEEPKQSAILLRLEHDNEEHNVPFICDIASSWSGVVSLGEFNSEHNQQLIDAEIILQSKWAYSDCLTDCAKESDLGLVQL